MANSKFFEARAGPGLTGVSLWPDPTRFGLYQHYEKPDELQNRLFDQSTKIHILFPERSHFPSQPVWLVYLRAYAFDVRTGVLQ